MTKDPGFAPAVRTAMRMIITSGSDEPPSLEALKSSDRGTPSQPRLRLVMGAIAFAVVATVAVAALSTSLIKPPVTGTSLDSAVPGDAGNLTSPEKDDPPTLLLESPRGPFVVTRMRGLLQGEVSEGATVVFTDHVSRETTELAVHASGSGDQLEFRHEFWLSLGSSNTISVRADSPGGSTAVTLRPIVLPSATTSLGRIRWIRNHRDQASIGFVPVSVIDMKGSPITLAPPTHRLYRLDEQEARALEFVDTQQDVTSLEVDRNAVVLPAPGVDQRRRSVPWGAWTEMLADPGHVDSTMDDLYWVTVHSGVVVQVYEVADATER